MRFKRLVVIILVTVMTIMTFGCAANNNLDENEQGKNQNDEQEQIVDDTPVYGGELVLPISRVDNLNPLITKDKSMYYFNKLIYEGLFEFDENLNTQNILAEDYEITDNGQIINIKLRDNVFWHDGEKFTADDVKFTIELIKYSALNSVYRDMMTSIYKPANPNDIEHILNVNVIDENNLEIHFDRSYSNALESLIFPILPKHRFAEDGVVNKSVFEKILNEEEFTPIGTGPYKFVEYNKLKSIKLTANQNWWKGKPYITNITGKILGGNDVTITSFESGLINLSPTSGYDWEKYAQREKVKIYEYVSQLYEFLAFNFNNELFQGEKGKALRRAIAYGIDRHSIIKKVYLGHATQVDVPISPNSWLISDEGNTYGYDTDKAREILESAGWTDNDNDGIYEDAAGKKLTIRLLTNSYNKLRRQTAEMIIENLKNIGINVIPMYDDRELDNITQNMVDNQWNEVQEKIANKDFDMALLGWELSYVPDLSFAFHSSQIDQGSNFISYRNEEMDELLVKAFRASTRESKREAYEQLQALIIGELPYVSLFFKNSSILVDGTVRGEIAPKSFNIYYDIDKWYIPEVYQTEEE